MGLESPEHYSMVSKAIHSLRLDYGTYTSYLENSSQSIPLRKLALRLPEDLSVMNGQIAQIRVVVDTKPLIVPSHY